MYGGFIGVMKLEIDLSIDVIGEMEKCSGRLINIIEIELGSGFID